MARPLADAVDTPVSLFRLQDETDPEPISIDSSEPILSVADVVLQEHDLIMPATLTAAENWTSRIRRSLMMKMMMPTMSRRPTNCS